MALASGNEGWYAINQTKHTHVCVLSLIYVDVTIYDKYNDVYVYERK